MLMNLPEKVLITILSYLSHCDIRSFSQTCKYLRFIAKSHILNSKDRFTNDMLVKTPKSNQPLHYVLRDGTEKTTLHIPRYGFMTTIVDFQK